MPEHSADVFSTISVELDDNDHETAQPQPPDGRPRGRRRHGPAPPAEPRRAARTARLRGRDRRLVPRGRRARPPPLQHPPRPERGPHRVDEPRPRVRRLDLDLLLLRGHLGEPAARPDRVLRRARARRPARPVDGLVAPLPRVHVPGARAGPADPDPRLGPAGDPHVQGQRAAGAVPHLPGGVLRDDAQHAARRPVDRPRPAARRRLPGRAAARRVPRRRRARRAAVRLHRPADRDGRRVVLARRGRDDRRPATGSAT